MANNPQQLPPQTNFATHKPYQLPNKTHNPQTQSPMTHKPSKNPNQ